MDTLAIARTLARVADEPSPDQLMDIYARKSVKVAGHRADLSHKTQIQRGRDWASWHKLTVRKVWQDTESASKDRVREDYDKALLALANGEIKTLWCYKLDRFSRKGALAVLSVCESLNGGRIIFGEDGLDTSDPTHRRMIMWRAEDAREEAERISQRVRDTKQWQRDHGEWVSGRTPYGLAVDEHRKLIPDTTPADPDHPRKGSRATIAQRMFRIAEKGLSLRAICKELAAKGVPGPDGTDTWNLNTVYRILMNPVYSGWQIHRIGKKSVVYTTSQGKRVKVGVELVPEAQRLRAVRAIQGHGKPREAFSGKARHLLTGLTRCASCARAMPVEGRSYTCGSRVQSTGRPCAAPASAYRPPVEAYVVDRWLSRLTNADADDPLLIVVAQRWAAFTQPDVSEEAEEARAVLRSAEDALERLLRDRRAGLYEGPASRFFEPAWADALRDVSEATDDMRRFADTATDISFLLDRESAMEAWEDAGLPLRRELLRLAIDRIEITRKPGGGTFVGDDRVTLRWASVA